MDSTSKNWTTAWDLDVYEMLPANVRDELRRMFGLIATRGLGREALVVSDDAAWCADCERMVPSLQVVANVWEALHGVEWCETTGERYCEYCGSTVWADDEKQWLEWQRYAVAPVDSGTWAGGWFASDRGADE